MQIKTQAIVLKTLRYSEADLIAKLYTPDKGVLSFLLKGVLKSKKAKIRASYFQIGTQLEIDYTYSPKANLQRLKEVKVGVHYEHLSLDIFKSSVATFVLEVLHNVLLEEAEDEACYRFVEKALQWLDTSEDYLLFHHYFLLQLTGYLGFFPTEEAYDYSYVHSNEDFRLFTPLLQTDLEQLKSFKINKEGRELLLEQILRYYQLHLSDFRTPNSLSVFQALFS